MYSFSFVVLVDHFDVLGTLPAKVDRSFCFWGNFNYAKKLTEASILVRAAVIPESVGMVSD